jgi:hypothetical protein
MIENEVFWKILGSKKDNGQVRILGLQYEEFDEGRNPS